MGSNPAKRAIFWRKTRLSGWSEGLLLYAGHVPALGGESPLRSRESEPLSEGKGVTARWGLEEAGATTTP